MIKFVSIRNWGPFRNTTEWHSDLLNAKNKDYYDCGISSMSLLYGNNLSGKSAFIEALKFIKEIISGPEYKIGFGYTDYYFNGPKEGIQYKNEPTEIKLEFAIHNKIYRYEIALTLHDRSIISERLYFKPQDAASHVKFKKVFTRENYTEIHLYFDLQEFGHLFERYFSELDTTVINRLTCFNGALDIEEISDVYYYMRNTLKFINNEEFVITETCLSLQDMLIPNLMDVLEDMKVPVDGYSLIELDNNHFIDMHSQSAEDVRRYMNMYANDSVNIMLINNKGIFFITNTATTEFKCYQLFLSSHGVYVNSKGLHNIVKLALMLVCNDDAVYIYDDFIGSVDEKFVEEFFNQWRLTVRYKMIIAACSNVNYMDCLDRADVNLIEQEKGVSKIINPNKDLHIRHDCKLSKFYKSRNSDAV